MAGVGFRVRGLVQGVGFRPHVWRLAHELGLTGEVLNDGEGVLISAYGDPAALAGFRERLSREAPPLSRIDVIEESVLAGTPPGTDFVIVESRPGRVRTGIVPDAATCPQCLADIRDPGNRRYRYPFANCTHCGPRLSIVRAIPYDRANTSMAAFPMCPACAAEYADPADRRFHAQPNACPACGPGLWLEGPAGELAEGETVEGDPIERARALILDGAIVAVKGIGGFHLACDAADGDAVERLRARKHRYAKPFALMARDLATVAEYADLSDAEAGMLASAAAPIVVLETRRDRTQLPAAVAPGRRSLGFMLPYTPLHHLLMDGLDRPVVLTSGNRSDEPQAIGNDEARERLGPIADWWLMHDRDIVNRLDDSVVRVMAGAPTVLRGGRGLAPATFPLPAGFAGAATGLGMGGELKATFCLLKEGEAILSQHIGDLEEASVHADYRRNLELYRQIFDFDPAVVAVDMHPDYLSAQWGRNLVENEGLRLEEVQHHHAHIASCMAEHGLDLDHPPVLGIVLDGLGHGADGTVWGGEFLLADYRGFDRLAHFMPAPLIGGTKAMKQPWRNAYAFLDTCLGWQEVLEDHAELPIVALVRTKSPAILRRMIEQGLNTPMAVSAGRLFDAAAAILGICPDSIAYEGQAAIEMEALAAVADDHRGYGHAIRQGVPAVIDWTPLWREMLADLSGGTPRQTVAARFHNGVAAAVAGMAKALAAGCDFEKIVLSGGVFQNRLLLEGVAARLRSAGLQVLIHRQVPPNDGGIALGQAVIAAARSLGAG